MTNATAADYELISQLTKEGIFEELKGDLVPAEQGTIVVPCADGDRITDLLRRHWGMCCGKGCHHTLALNGGPLLIPVDSPIAVLNEGEVLLNHILGANKLKNISTVALYGHWPCGAAISANMRLGEALEWCVKAKDEVRNRMKENGLDPTVVLCFHVEFADGSKTGYHFNRRAWDARRAERFAEAC